MDMLFKLITDLEKAVGSTVDLNIHKSNKGSISSRCWYGFCFSWFDKRTKVPTFMQYNLFSDELEKDKKKSFATMENFLNNEIHILKVKGS